MTVLNVVYSLSPALGGVPTAAITTCKMLAATGHVGEIVTMDEKDDPWISASAPVVHAVGRSRSRFGWNPHLERWLRAHIADYDAVIVHGIWQYHAHATWRILRRRAIPYHVYIHGMLDPWFQQNYPLKHLKKRLYWPFIFPVLRDAASLLFTCEEERDLARGAFHPYKVTEDIVPLGIEKPERTSEDLKNCFRTQFPELQDKRIFLTMGRIHPIKGFDVLISAFSEACQAWPDTHLVIVGPDPDGLIPQFKDLASRMGISDRLTFTGMLGSDLKWGAFYSAEIFLLPSHHENFGAVVVEGMSTSLPVLVSDKVQIWRTIIAAGAGIVGPDDNDGTVRSISTWLTMPKQQQALMATRALQCYERHYTIETAAQALLTVLTQDPRASGARLDEQK